MGGAGWSLKGPQPGLQESLASSFTPFCLTRHSPPPFLLLPPACLPGLPVDPLQASPSCSGELSGPVGTTLQCAFPLFPRGRGLGHEQ